MWFRVGDGVHGPHNGHVATGHGLVDDLFGNVAAFVAGVHNAKLRIPKIPGVQVVVVVKGVDALQGHQQGKGVVVVGFVSLYGGWWGLGGGAQRRVGVCLSLGQGIAVV